MSKCKSDYPFLDEIREDYRIKVQNGELNCETKVPFWCNIHQEYYLQTLYKHSNGQGCPKCRYIKSAKSQIKTDYFFIDEIRKDYQEKVKNGEVSGKTKIPFICNIHGEYWQSLIAHSKGQGCPKCGIKKLSNLFSKKEYTFINEIREDYQQLIKNGELNNRSKVPFICPIHGEYWQELRHHSEEHNCPICGNNKRSFNKITKIYPFMEEIREDYQLLIKNGEITQKDKIIFICKEHGEYSQTLECHLRGQNCPKCSNNISNSEIELYNFVKEYYPNTINNIRNLIPNRQLELDIYIPELKIGIEYNGLIWHSEKFDNNKYNLLNKTKEFNNIGIRVIHIFEDEWLFKNDIVKKKLLHILNVDKSKRIFARKCIVKEIDVNSCKTFLNNNHLQGYYRSKHRFGLFTKNTNELVAVMTFINSKISSSLKDWEMSRYATNCNIIGGFDKLFKYAKNIINFKKVVTFADLRWSDLNNNIYEKTGWIKEYITKPNYFYVGKGFEKIYRFGMRKSILKDKLDYFDPKLTEVENCAINGYYRLFDCGNIKYSKLKDDIL
jgi:DNA-directed RNA polymerase subunit M/transcription elongation factor TFIIS